MYNINVYICNTQLEVITITLKSKKMKTQERNIAKALETARDILTKMLSEGLGDAKYVFVLSNMISETFNLSKDQSIIVIEEALKIA